MKRSLIALAVVSMLCTAVQADYIDLPIKWSQADWAPYDPDLRNSAYPSSGNQVMADDFFCDDADPIVAVRWWGTYGPEAGPRSGQHPLFDISFHFSQGAHPTSLPGTLLYLEEVRAQEVYVGNFYAGTYVYRYDAYLPLAFYQEQYSAQSPNPGELFVNIYLAGTERWYWMSLGPPHPRAADYAASSSTGHNGPWTSTSYEIDMAFELMTPEPATMGLVGLGLVALVRRRRRK